ncbi:MAG: peptidoglycan recognition family protein [Leptolyngbyaceae cyanobacterium bins.302]|nr:peptidoglycan recognition family protein [Leptolyngbyaceae cyanobacterium bins.302]
MGTWIKETDIAMYLMEGNNYLERILKDPRPNGEKQLDVSAMKRWFARSDSPGGMVVSIGVNLPEPPPKPRTTPKPAVKFIAASSANFTSREGTDIDTIIIHNTVGTTESAISVFKNPAAKVSAHYIVDRSGEIIQMVRDSDCAYHAGNPGVNFRSIGIEHEATFSQRGLTPAQNVSSVALIKFLMSTYRIPITHIRPHSDIVGTECPNLIFPTKADLQRWIQTNFTIR